MLSRKNIIFYILSFVAIVAILAFLFRSKNQRTDWRETYNPDTRSPYGLEVILELLKGYFPGQPLEALKDSINGQLPTDSEQANYIFIGEGLYLDSVGLGALLEFVEAGNLAFISSKTIPFDLMENLYYGDCEDTYWEDYYLFQDTMARLNFEHPSLHREKGFPYKYLLRHQVAPYNWSYIDPYLFCEEEGMASIGTLNDSLPIFARVGYGDGYFYLHTIPLAFTNIQLLDEEGLEYANRTFSHLQPGPIYWDDYSRVSEWMGRRRNERQYYSSSRQLSTESPLQYILGQPPLAWGWYLLLSLGLLYLLFRAKRKQRIIPVLEPNTNTSLEFLSTIGRLYFMQNNHKQLALQQMKLWQSYLREHYFLQTRDMDSAFVEKLAHKSEISKEVINKILLLYRNISSSTFVSENTLIDLHRLLDNFYKNSK